MKRLISALCLAAAASTASAQDQALIEFCLKAGPIIIESTQEIVDARSVTQSLAIQFELAAGVRP